MTQDRSPWQDRRREMSDERTKKRPAACPSDGIEDGGYFARRHWITAEEARELVNRASNDHVRFG